MDEVQVVRIKDIGPGHAGQTVRVRCWLRNKPGSKGRYFLWLRDGSGEIQAVAEQSLLSEATWADVERIGIESSIIVDGEVRAHPKNPDEFELELRHLTVVQTVSDYPIGKKSHGVDFLMKNRHLWLRGKRQSAILRIRSELSKAISDFMHERGFYRVDTPIFTPNACEGTTTLFDVDYHGDTVYLAQSGQLYNEADIGALGQVYCFGPTFRAEKSKTRRHLLEFWMLEMEAAYFDHFDNMAFQEELMAFMVRAVLSSCLADLRLLERDPAVLEPALQTPYPRVRYGETIDTINRARLASLIRDDTSERIAAQFGATTEQIYEGFLSSGLQLIQTLDDMRAAETDAEATVAEVFNYGPFHWGDDYGAPDEVAIGAQYDRPVFVTNFPVEIKGFYFKDELNDNGSERIDPEFARLKAEQPYLVREGTSGHTVAGSDLLGPEGAGELSGGSQREDDLDKLNAKIAHHKLPPEFLEWYVDLRRYGSVPHSGFGLGFERTIAWICGGAENVHIRETIAFPRMLHQFEP